MVPPEVWALATHTFRCNVVANLQEICTRGRAPLMAALAENNDSLELEVFLLGGKQRHKSIVVCETFNLLPIGGRKNTNWSFARAASSRPPDGLDTIVPR